MCIDRAISYVNTQQPKKQIMLISCYVVPLLTSSWNVVGQETRSWGVVWEDVREEGDHHH